MKLEKSNIGEMLPCLLDQIHDRYFSLDSIAYNRDRSEWKLFFGQSTKGPFDRVLKVTGVHEYICHDTVRIGIYDMNKLIIDIDKQLITLECNEPLDIRLFIDPGFQICLECQGAEMREE